MPLTLVEHGGDVVAAGRVLEGEPQDDQGEAQQRTAPGRPACMAQRFCASSFRFSESRCPFNTSIVSSIGDHLLCLIIPGLPRVLPW